MNSNVYAQVHFWHALYGSVNIFYVYIQGCIPSTIMLRVSISH